MDYSFPDVVLTLRIELNAMHSMGGKFLTCEVPLNEKCCWLEETSPIDNSVCCVFRGIHKQSLVKTLFNLQNKATYQMAQQ